jgi:hypothetical protein
MPIHAPTSILLGDLFTWRQNWIVGREVKIMGGFTCTKHNITQRHGSSEYNNGMLGAQFEFESPTQFFLCIPLLYLEGAQNECRVLSNVMR